MSDFWSGRADPGGSSSRAPLSEIQVLSLAPEDAMERAAAVRAVVWIAERHEVTDDGVVWCEGKDCSHRNHRRDMEGLRRDLDELGLLEDVIRCRGLPRARPPQTGPDPTMPVPADDWGEMLNGVLK